MESFFDRDISRMVDMSFDCCCGKSHSVEIKNIYIEKGIADRALELLKPYKSGTILMVADKNTFPISGAPIREALDKEGYKIKILNYDGCGQLVPDEKAIGRLLVEADRDMSLILAVGSGTINDLSRFVSYKLGVPYMIAGTAPSMDGYASTVSPLIVQGTKKTYPAVYPVAVMGDLDAMLKAPSEMLCAGFGDVLGKLTALADWKLSSNMNGEYICPDIMAFVVKAVNKCIDNAAGIAARNEEAIVYLSEALIMTGLAIGMVGDSRPASGSEHHLAHYWEVSALARGVDHPLHGNSVGVGTVIISYIYNMVGNVYNTGIETPDPVYVRGLLKAVGAVDNPFELGIDRRVFHNSILHAKEIRPRYTVLHLAEKLGILEKAAEKLTDMFYA